MIVVGVSEGLGNKMFHYAFGRYLMAKGLDVYYDVESYIPDPKLLHEHTSLTDAFPYIEIKKAPKGMFPLAYIKSSHRSLNRALIWFKRGISLISTKKYIIERDFGYQKDIYKQCKDDCICLGHWQSEKYFLEIRDEILRQFKFLPFDEVENIKLAARMASENSVAIHVRKGKDYWFDSHICDANYYHKAIEYIRSKVWVPTLYVFTDNKDWVRTNFVGVKYTLVECNETTGNRSFRDMQLMTYAKHNIIANSSYSWWGAWLNRNPQKIVIAPETFFPSNKYYYSKSDVVCTGWICI